MKKDDAMRTATTTTIEVATTFDWENEGTYAKLLRDVKIVFFCVPSSIDHWERHYKTFVKACITSGVRHFVKLSTYHFPPPQPPHGNGQQQRCSTVPGHHPPLHEEEVRALVRLHDACDRVLIKASSSATKKRVAHVQSGSVLMTDMTPRMSYTILRTCHLMSDPFARYHQDNVIVSGGGDDDRVDDENIHTCHYYGTSGKNHGIHYASPNDVSEAAVRVMLNPHAHTNQEYNITGPRSPIAEREVARLLSKHLKKEVVYVDQSMHEFKKTMKFIGIPRWKVHELVALETMKASSSEGDERRCSTHVSKDFYEICGHPPENFKEYLQMHGTMTTVELGCKDALIPLAVSA